VKPFYKKQKHRCKSCENIAVNGLYVAWGDEKKPGTRVKECAVIALKTALGFQELTNQWQSSAVRRMRPTTGRRWNRRPYALREDRGDAVE